MALQEDLIIFGLKQHSAMPMREVFRLDLWRNLAQRSDGCPGDVNVKKQFHQKF